MSQNFQAGDFLIFQIESGYGLLRILGIDETAGGKIYYLRAYEDLFLDIEQADQALENPQNLKVNLPFVALTERAFLSTQTARMKNVALDASETAELEQNKNSSDFEISDRSIRLMLGLR